MNIEKEKQLRPIFNGNKGLLVSDDLPQRRKSTLEFILLSIIHASEHLLIVSRDLSEEEGKEDKQHILGGRCLNRPEAFQTTHAAFSLPFLELLIGFSRDYFFLC